MKKILSILLATILVGTCFVMIGCGGANGTYEFYGVEISGKLYKGEEEVEIYGYTFKANELAEDYFEFEGGIELAKDNVIKDKFGTVKEDMAWFEVDGGVCFAIEDEVIFLRKDGDELIYTEMVEVDEKDAIMKIIWKKV